MSFDASAGRIVITDGATTVFDTNQDLLHLLSPVIAGSYSFPSVDWPGNSAGFQAVRNQDFFVANVPAGTTHIVGLVRFDIAAGGSNAPVGMPTGAWYQAGGSFLVDHKTFVASNNTIATYPTSMISASFYLSGTTIRFNEELRLYDGRAEFLGLLYPSYTVTYRLFPAAFS